MVQHSLAAVALLFLAVTESYSWLWASAFSWFFFYVIGEGIFLHRYFAHQAFECRPIVAKTGAVLAMLGAFGTPISWRVYHVTHHGHSDTDKDPHSPVTKGFWYAYIGWQLDPQPQRLNIAISKKLWADPFYKFLELNSVRIWYAGMLVAALIDWRLCLFLALGSSWGLFLSGWTNSLCHMKGTRRFDTKDNSRNITWFSWLTWQGSGALHNNHHAYPSRHHDSWAWYEFDIAKWLVPILKKL